MKNPIPVRAPTLFLALATVVVVIVMHVDLAAEEPPPAPRPWRPVPAVPPRGPFFGGQALPNPIPVPMPPPFPVPNPNSFPFPLQPPNGDQVYDPLWLPQRAFEPGVTRSTDRCLIISSGNAPAFVKTAADGIDPGMIKEPGVQGLPIGSPAGWQGSLTPWEANGGPMFRHRP